MSATAKHSSGLAKALAEFRATRAHTLTMIDGLTQLQLDFAPAPDRWAVGEIVDHMLLIERMNRQQIAKLIELRRKGHQPELSLTFSDLNISLAGVPRSVLPVFAGPITFMNMFVPDSLRNYLTRKSWIPFRNPDPATPNRGRLVTELRRDLAGSMQETDTLFQRNPDVNFSELVLRHPLLGSYDVPGLLRFMSAHEQRHQSQIDNVMASPRFPNYSSRKGAGHA